MAGKTKPEIKELPLTAAQVDKINAHSLALNDAQRRLTDYASGILDANSLEGTWDLLGIEGDPPVLRVQRKQ